MTQGYFVQDDIKVNQKLTLNLGLRYEFYGITSDEEGNYTNIWPSAVLQVPVPGNSVATGSLAGWVVPANYKGPMFPGLTMATNDSSLQSTPQKNNFAPRIGFAWQPFTGGKFVVRGGYGFFYDRIPGTTMIHSVNTAPPLAPPNYFSGSSGYFATLQSFQYIPSGTYGYRWVNLATGNSSAIGESIFDSHPRTPLTETWSLNVQYNFLPSWVLEVGYVGNHSVHLAQEEAFDFGQIATPSNPIWGVTTDTAVNSSSRLPLLGFSPSSLTLLCTCFDEKYDSLQTTVRKQFTHGFSAQAAYTWSKQLVSNWYPSYLGTAEQLYGIPGSTTSPARPQTLRLNYSWNLPFGKPKGVLGVLASGWNLSGVTTIQTGNWLTITDGRGGTIYGINTALAQIAPGKTYANIPSPGSIGNNLGGGSGGCGFFNCATSAAGSPFTTIPAFVTPAGAVTNGLGEGNMGQGVVLGPGQFNFDLSLSKMTRVGGIHENAALQFRAEFFNVFNHPQFSNPGVVDSSSGTFGVITSTTVNPRVIQLALKYIF